MLLNEKGNRFNSDAVPATVSLANLLVIVIKLLTTVHFEWEGE